MSVCLQGRAAWCWVSEPERGVEERSGGDGSNDRKLVTNWGFSIKLSKMKTVTARVLPLGERQYNYGKVEK